MRKKYLRKIKLRGIIFGRGMRQIRVVNYAQEFSENYFLVSYVNFAQFNMEEYEVCAAANYTK